MVSINVDRRMTESEKKNYIKRKKQLLTEGPGKLRQRPKRPSWPKGYDPDKQQDPKNFKRTPKPREEITDRTRKEELRKKLQRPFPKLPSRKLTPEQRERIKRKIKSSRITEGEPGRKLSTMEKKFLLKSGRPKLAIKGWRS